MHRSVLFTRARNQLASSLTGRVRSGSPPPSISYFKLELKCVLEVVAFKCLLLSVRSFSCCSKHVAAAAAAVASPENCKRARSCSGPALFKSQVKRFLVQTSSGAQAYLMGHQNSLARALACSGCLFESPNRIDRILALAF